ncbi:MAG: hypothetical protein R3D71_08665 [Rickettsiales bacterium]
MRNRKYDWQEIPEVNITPTMDKKLKNRSPLAGEHAKSSENAD